WSRTPLGPVGQWPQALRIAVDICLASRFPMFVWWGPELINLHNDAYVPILGPRHPGALGRPARGIWGEIWPVVGPQADAVMTRGEATWNERVLLVMDRHGFPEETYFTWSYSPIRDGPDGPVGGLFCACTEETGRVLAERERDRLEAERRESEARYRAVFDASRDAKIIYTPDGTVVEANAAAGRMYGYAPGDVAGARAADVIHPDALPAFREFLRVAGAGGEFRCETVDRRRDGTAFPAEVIGTSFAHAGRTLLMSVVRDVAERKRAEEARRMVEFRFRRLVEHSPLSTQLFWPDGRTRQVNPAFTRLFGITLDELHDYNILRDPQLVTAGIAPLMARAFAGEPVVIDPIPYAPDRGEHVGQTRWAGAHVYPVKDDAGRVEEVVLVHHDVTEQRLAEDALRQSERRLRSLVDQSAAGIAQTDLTGRILFANQRYIEIVGYPPDEVVGLRVQDLTHPDDRAETAALVASGAATGREYAMEKRYIRKDGSAVWVAVSAGVIRDAAGRPQSIMGVVIDVSDRKRAEAALREGEERLRLGLDAGNTGTWDWDVASGRVTWSDRVYGFHGIPKGEFGGTLADFARVVHSEDRERVQAAIHRSVETGSPYEVEFRVVHRDGAVRWLTTNGRVFYDDAGRPARMLGATSDVTVRKHAEEERDRLLASERAARAEAERANEAKSEFIAVLSHELRTPLTPVLLAASLMESHPGLPDDLRADVATIKRNVELESRLISDLLDLTRIAQGKLKLESEVVDAHLLVRSAVDICQREDSPRLHVDLRATRHHVAGDPTRLQQVWWNLVNNAVRHGGPGAGVTVRTRDAAGGRLRVEVADDGEGIDPAVLPKLFTAFEQGEVRSKRQFAGLGLGLAICKKLVEAHGGTIAAASAGRGRGATFAVELP
ncbi:MAG: sensor hybrid histidine kinase, partial [Phycisphaerales bacterium]|nr:sensor hybrid histidine kinase [Phycisphaerales bacterium]